MINSSLPSCAKNPTPENSFYQKGCIKVVNEHFKGTKSAYFAALWSFCVTLVIFIL